MPVILSALEVEIIRLYRFFLSFDFDSYICISSRLHMKKTFLSAIAFAVLTTACSDKFGSDENTFIVAGHLSNSTSETVQVFIGDDEWESAAMEDGGEFNLRFEFDGPAYFTVTDGKVGYKVFMSPGDSIFISGDVENFKETAEASGDKAEEIRYIRDKARLENETGLHNIMQLMSKQPEAYLMAKDSAFNLIRERFEDLEQKEGIDPDFLTAESAYFTYSSLLLDRMYPMYHGYVNRMDPDSVSYPRESVEDEIAMLPKGNKKLLLCEPYVELIEYEIMKLSQAILESDTTAEPSLERYAEISWEATDSLLPDPEIRDFFFFQRLRAEIDSKGAWKVEDRLARFREINDSEQYDRRLKKIEEKWEPVKPGKDVPDFRFADPDGDPVYLSDFRGELVYIDIWATWCGPCIQEHPHWDALKADYSDQPVAFLTVSVDDRPEPWIKMVKDKGMDGHQLYTENAWKSDIAKHFLVNSIPRFILLDEEGKVIDPAADRPSGNIRETLDKHLSGGATASRKDV